MAKEKRAYSGGHFELFLDGHKTTAYMKSIDGGNKKLNIIEEGHGSDLNKLKHPSTVDIEPFTIECGMSGTNDILRLMEKSWKKGFRGFNGQVTHGDFDLRPVFEHEFFGAYLTEVIFPSLDGSVKDPAYLKFKFQPQEVVTRTMSGGGPRLQMPMSPKQKLWNPSNFRFTIDGIDDTQKTNKLESFTIKQGVKKHYNGPEQELKLQASNVVFPSLSGTIALAFADGLFRWHNETHRKRMSSARSHRTGSIEFLSPDLTKTLFAIHLYEVGITTVHVAPSTANQDQVKRAKFELSVGRMELDPGLPFGFG